MTHGVIGSGSTFKANGPLCPFACYLYCVAFLCSEQEYICTMKIIPGAPSLHTIPRRPGVYLCLHPWALGRARHGDTSTPGAVVPLGGHNHVVKGAHGHARALPGVEEVARRDGAAGPLVAPDGPVLVEGRGAIDGRRVGPRRLVQVVGAAVGRDGALGLGARARVVLAKVLEDVVLDQGGTSPPVDAEVLIGSCVISQQRRKREKMVHLHEWVGR